MPLDSAEVGIRVGEALLHGDLEVSSETDGIVIFAHGSGSSRLSPRNRSVATFLRQRGLGTLLFDLLTSEEECSDAVTREYRFDIAFLAQRLIAVTDWLAEQAPAHALGYFGASTGAAAALVAAAEQPRIRAVVSRGGRPDLAAGALEHVTAATLLIVGGNDPEVLVLNKSAFVRLACEKELAVVPGATHLFTEPGALEAVAEHAAAWFSRHLTNRTKPGRPA